MRSRFGYAWLPTAVALLALCGSVRAERTDFPPVPTERYAAAGEYLWFEKYKYGHRAFPDDAGIPRMARWTGGPLVYNPVLISQHGLRAWSLWVGHRDRHALGVAYDVGEWLLANQERDGRWLYRFDFPLAGIDATMRSPWASAMQQGQAMSLLTRLWRRDRDGRWLRAARRAVRPLARSVAEGGLTARFRGQPFYEEYPSRPRTYTLNGFMFTLIGLHDLASTGRSTLAERYFADGLRTLETVLPYYDRGRRVSAYHLSYLTDPPRPPHTSVWYHRVHVIELKALFEITGARVLADWRRRWARVPLREP